MDRNKITKMAEGGRLIAQIRDRLMTELKPGVTLLELEHLAQELIDASGGKAAFKNVPGYHFATCISINEGIVHGIPTARKLKTGDLVGIDIGLYYQGYYLDTADTAVVGKPSALQAKLLATCRQALEAGIAQAKVGNRVSDVSKVVQKITQDAGFVVIRDLTGHGVGKRLHEDPYIPNYFDPQSPDPVFRAGQTVAIEPMISVSSPRIKIAPDGWTITTADNSLSVQIEHTVAILPSGPQILTVAK